MDFGYIITTLSALVALIGGVWLWAKGALPVLYRLGMGLATRKIALFATKESEYHYLFTVLASSNIFKAKNIIRIPYDRIEVAKEEKCSVYVVSYCDFKDKLDNIVQMKNDAIPLIIYSSERIDPAVANPIQKIPNVSLVNYPGRLVSDVFVSMATTN
jgi:hypothetical protein